MKSKLKRYRKKIAAMGFLAVAAINSIPVCAAGSGRILASGELVSGMNNLKTLFTAVVSCIGYFVLIKGVMSLSTAISQRDNSGLSQAIGEIAGGAIAAVPMTILTVLGLQG